MGRTGLSAPSAPSAFAIQRPFSDMKPATARRSTANHIGHSCHRRESRVELPTYKRHPATTRERQMHLGAGGRRCCWFSLIPPINGLVVGVSE